MQCRKSELLPKRTQGRNPSKRKAVFILASHSSSLSLKFLICRIRTITRGVHVKIKSEKATGTG